jgi:glycosyltransferase involved in cell wall biosynthesis
MHCLASLEAQTYHNIEVIVVDDASTDTTQERLRSAHTRFPLKVIRLEENHGAPAARNRGEKEAQGTYLLFLDADVELRPHALDVLMKALDQSGAQFAYSAFRFGWKLFRGYPFDAERLKHMPYIHTSALMRREVFPGFDESLKKFQDWDLWLTVVERGGKGVWVPELLFTVEVRKEGMSRWLPSIFHVFPWRWFGWMPKELQKYRKWEKILKEKHGITS